ncbi:hypothetical protein GCM10011343_27900 [Flavobacterium orientale]|uniref:CarboxypepD_reg-like domain-containing protein n=2 Tax=Flavobacterium orientale TaxID=1756020 RepID=A0A916YAY8_9FLAO|nr:hypothetical protein GCM10011343_27900 [Flavobacterium orientale]
MTDEQIINFLNNKEESICARLNRNQMNRVLKTYKTNKIKSWNKIAATFALMSLATVSYSNTTEFNNFKIELNSNDLSENKKDNKNQTSSSDSIRKIIKGKVVDEDLEYPVKTSVIIKGTKIKTKTDASGNFQIVIPKNYKKEEITLLIKSTGLEDDTEIKIQISELPKYDLIIKKNGMMIGEIIKKRKRWWQFWK